jgi:transcriptional regulator with XRE-family HTH domain
VAGVPATGAALRSFRLAQGWTQAQLAQRLGGLHQPQISLLEGAARLPAAIRSKLKRVKRGRAAIQGGGSAMDGEALQRKRLRLGYTQSEMARKLKSHQSEISQWESGKKPIPANVAKAVRKLR